MDKLKFESLIENDPKFKLMVNETIKLSKKYILIKSLTHDVVKDDFIISDDFKFNDFQKILQMSDDQIMLLMAKEANNIFLNFIERSTG